MSVLITPGAYALTVIPCRPNSCAVDYQAPLSDFQYGIRETGTAPADCVRPRTANLDALYAEVNGRACRENYMLQCIVIERDYAYLSSPPWRRHLEQQALCIRNRDRIILVEFAPMILPPRPCFSICSAANLYCSITPRAFTRMTRSKSSTVAIIMHGSDASRR